jgi:hypothetical protein
MFVKDMSLPISIVESPYFEHHIHFLDRQYNTLEKVKLLEDALAQFDNEEAFMSEMRKVREGMISRIKSHPDYQKMSGTIAKKSIDPATKKIPDRSIYKIDMCNKRLISLDLVSANFYCFKAFAPSAVDNKDNYRDFASQFTDVEYFLNSKKIRQIVFGNLNPKIQQSLMKATMYQIYHELNVAGSSPTSITSDEIIFDTNLKTDYYRSYADSRKDKIDIKVSEFQIEKVPTKISSMFYKNFPDGSFDLKCCRADYVVEVLRHKYNEPCHPYDKIFYNDGRACEYKDSLF